MIKKSLVALFGILLTFTFGTNVFASENDETQKGLEVIEQYNILIDDEISKTQQEADVLYNTYLSNMEAFVATEEITDTTELTNQFNAELDQLISDLDVLTRAITAEGITKAAEYGVQSECNWKWVQFANKWAWIDPIRVVGI